MRLLQHGSDMWLEGLCQPDNVASHLANTYLENPCTHVVFMNWDLDRDIQYSNN